jgi:predicted RNase H-like HicB family nuclease
LHGAESHKRCGSAAQPAHHLARAAAVDGQAHQLARGVARLTSTLAHISVSGDVLSVQNSLVSGEEVSRMNFQIEVEREEDGRWIAEVPDLPGVLVYAEDRATAVLKAQALAIRVLAERLEREGKQHLKERARRGSRERYDAALAEVPDVAPKPYDRLAEACANLDLDEEHALAEEGLAADFDAWPEYSAADGGSEQERQVTARLDEIYATEDSRLDPAFRRAQCRSLELREELDRRLADQAANPGVGRPWSEVKARLLGTE